MRLSIAVVVFWSVAHLICLGLLWFASYRSVAALRYHKTILAGAYGIAAAIAAATTGMYRETLLILSLVLGTGLLIARRLPKFAVTWHLFLTNALFCSVAGVFWSLELYRPVAGMTRLHWLAAGGYGLSLIAALIACLRTVVIGSAEFQALFRRCFARPLEPLEPNKAGPFRRVSLHVPCYAEPPDVVIRTLNGIARLNHPNFEVLVIDNNTKDPELWRPLERRCQELGPRFRFFHVDPLAGAKGGALNFALQHTDPAAEIVGVLDADYVPDPAFLERLVGFFDEPTTGFVQSPHDYRDYQHSWFQRACYWEYKPFYSLLLPGWNQWDAAFTVGTMCLVRRKVLDEIGGWSETCLTEDSELGLRIHAQGYQGHYVSVPFGWGLVPETFAEYQKQRFRWAAGPVQQLKMHWRTLLPSFLGGSTKMARVTKFNELTRSSPLSGLLLYGGALSSVAIAADLVMRDAALPPLPLASAMAIVMMLVTRLTFAVLRGRLLDRSFVDAVLGQIASNALMHVKAIATIRALFSKKHGLAWRRTSKFKAKADGWRALGTVLPETILGLCALGVGLGLLAATKKLEPDFISLVALGMLSLSLSFFCAPIMVLLAERDLRSEAASEATVKLRFAESLRPAARAVFRASRAPGATTSNSELPST